MTFIQGFNNQNGAQEDAVLGKYLDAQVRYNNEVRKYNVSWGGASGVMDSMGANNRVQHRGEVDKLLAEVKLYEGQLARIRGNGNNSGNY